LADDFLECTYFSMNRSKADTFLRTFHSRPELLSSAPGRINLIGEHTDYNNGYVLPAAIHLRTHFLMAPRPDDKVRIWTENFQEEEAFDLKAIVPSESRRWANYVKGIFWVLKQEGLKLGGVNAMIWGEVPLESGLSSSASLEVSVIKGLSTSWNIDLPPLEMAKLAQRAENDFVGVKCGLMDQFISVLGRKDSAVFLDCETLEYAYYPLSLEKAGLAILVHDTRVPRKLAASEYNKRRQESTQALEILKQKGIRSYKEATTSLLESSRSEIGPVPYKRAKHVITENERVRRAVEALQKDDFSGLGALLFHSHESLRDDYEVSCPELDLLYDVGKDFSGCLGARLVGAGFGGSGIALIEKRAEDAFRKRLLDEAEKRRFPRPEFYRVAIGQGAAASKL
jgi:galactokinase